ncbi:MAG: hypothetical protein ABIG95_03380 [Candidatus Woesearchaeota archaeon]
MNKEDLEQLLNDSPRVEINPTSNTSGKKGRWDTTMEIAAGTFDWYCTFLPVVAQKIKKRVFGRHSDTVDKEKQELSDYIGDRADRAERPTLEILNQAAFSGRTKKLYDRMANLDVIGSMERFWAYWNPTLTKETTQKVYSALGGNKKPVLSTLGTFVYSGLFVHAAIVAPICAGAYLATRDPDVLSPIISLTSLYTALGVPIAAKKALKLRQKSKKNEDANKGLIGATKATITGGIMAAYAYGSWELGNYIADTILK